MGRGVREPVWRGERELLGREDREPVGRGERELVRRGDGEPVNKGVKKEPIERKAGRESMEGEAFKSKVFL